MRRARSPLPPTPPPAPSPTEGLFVLEHGDRKVVVFRPPTYNDALDAVDKQFPALSNTPRTQIRLTTAKLGASGGVPVEVSEESWMVVSKLIDSVTITVIPYSNGSNGDRDQVIPDGGGGSVGSCLSIHLQETPSSRVSRQVVHRLPL
jgi:hypothetical protein